MQQQQRRASRSTAHEGVLVPRRGYDRETLVRLARLEHEDRWTRAVAGRLWAGRYVEADLPRGTSWDVRWDGEVLLAPGSGSYQRAQRELLARHLRLVARWKRLDEGRR